MGFTPYRSPLRRRVQGAQGGQEREIKFPSRPVIPRTFDITVRDQARVQPPTRTPGRWKRWAAPTPEEEAQRAYIDNIANAAEVRQQTDDAARNASQEAYMRLQETQQAYRERAQAEAREQTERLLQAFMPTAPNSFYQQAAMFDNNIPLDRKLDYARRAQGIASLREFKKVYGTMTPEEKAQVGTLGLELIKEGVDAGEFKSAVDTLKRGKDGTYAIPANKRRIYNRILQRVGATPPPGAGDGGSGTFTEQLPGAQRFLGAQAPEPLPSTGQGYSLNAPRVGQELFPEDEGINRAVDIRQRDIQREYGVPLIGYDNPEGLTTREAAVGQTALDTGLPYEQIAATQNEYNPDEGFKFPTRETGMNALRGLRDIGQGVGEATLTGLTPNTRNRGDERVIRGLGEVGLSIDDIIGRGTPISEVFTAEQEAFAPLSRGPLEAGLKAMGLPEGGAATTADYISQFAVPSSLIGLSEGNLALRALREGTINALQNVGYRHARGEEASPLESALVFVAGAGLVGGLPKVGSFMRSLKRLIGAEVGGPVDPVLRDVRQEAADRLTRAQGRFLRKYPDTATERIRELEELQRLREVSPEAYRARSSTLSDEEVELLSAIRGVRDTEATAGLRVEGEELAPIREGVPEGFRDQEAPIVEKAPEEPPLPVETTAPITRGTIITDGTSTGPILSKTNKFYYVRDAVTGKRHAIPIEAAQRAPEAEVATRAVDVGTPRFGEQNSPQLQSYLDSLEQGLKPFGDSYGRFVRGEIPDPPKAPPPPHNTKLRDWTMQLARVRENVTNMVRGGPEREAFYRRGLGEVPERVPDTELSTPTPRRVPPPEDLTPTGTTKPTSDPVKVSSDAEQATVRETTAARDFDEAFPASGDGAPPKGTDTTSSTPSGSEALNTPTNHPDPIIRSLAENRRFSALRASSEASMNREAMSALEHRLIQYEAPSKFGRAVQQATGAAEALPGVGEKPVYINKAGEITRGVTPKQPGLSLKWQDVFENPSQYNWDVKELKQLQEEWVNRFKPYQQKLIDRELLDPEAPNRTYITRVVRAIDGERVRAGPHGDIGATQDLLLTRQFDTAAEGAEKNVEYLQSISGSLYYAIIEAERRSADYDFAQAFLSNPITRGRLATENIPSDLTTGRDTLVNLERARKETIKKLEAQNRGLRASKGAIRGAKGSREATAGNVDAIIARNEEKIAAAEQDLADIQESLTGFRGERARLMESAKRPKAGKEASIRAPFASGRMFPKEVASAYTSNIKVRPTVRIGKVEVPLMGENLTGGLQSVANFNNLLRGVNATFDLSATGLQTIAALSTNPVAYAEMMGKVVKAMADPQNYFEYVRNNESVVREMIEKGYRFLGTDVGFDGQDISMLGPVSQGIRRATLATTANDSWNRQVNIIAIEQFKTAKELVEGLDEAGAIKQATRLFNQAFTPLVGGNSTDPLRGALRAISHMTGKLTIDEMASQGPGQTLARQLFPFAGNYWDAWGRLIAESLPLMVRKTGEGKGVPIAPGRILTSNLSNAQANRARKAIAGWMGTAFGLYYAGAVASGQPAFFDPTDPLTDNYFMTLDVGGVRMGVGGPLQQIMRYAGELSQRPEDAHSITTKWLRGKSSPIISILADTLEGETYIGDRVGLKEALTGKGGGEAWIDTLSYFASRGLPFSLQDPVKETLRGKPQSARERLIEAPATALGLRAFPRSLFEELRNNKQSVYEGLRSGEIKGSDLSPELAHIDFVDYLKGAPSTFREFAEENTLLNSYINDHPSVRSVVERIDAEGLDPTKESQYFDFEDTMRERFLNGYTDEEGNFHQGQEERDRLLKAGTMPPETWRETSSNEYSKLGAILETQREQLGVNFEKEYTPGTVNAVVRDFFDISLEDYTDRVTGEVDYKGYQQEQNAALSGLTPSDRLLFKAAMSRNLTPMRREYFDDVEKIADSGYWDIQDKAWDAIRVGAVANGTTLPRSLDEYQKAEEQRLISSGVRPDAARALSQNNGYVRGYNRIASGMRILWRNEHPSTIRLLDKWGYNAISQTDLGPLYNEQ